MKLLLKYKSISALFIALSAVYLAAIIFEGPDKAILAKYDLTATQLVWLSLTVALPYVIIWFIALFGYLRFRWYSAAIKDSSDGAAFAVISRGLLLLSVWLPVSAVSSTLAKHLYQAHPSYTSTMVILVNYANVALLFTAFLIINSGARKLLGVVKNTVNAVSQRTTILYLVFSGLYGMLTLEDSARHAPTHSVAIASYYLPDWLIVTTIVIPRLIMWFLGVQAIEDIMMYRKKVKGKIYKLALQNVARGITAVIIATILLRCFESLSSPIGELSLGLVVLLVYLLLVALAIGYVLIYRGARSLQKIEDL